MAEDIQNILLLEDSPTDAELIKRQVKKVFPKARFTVADGRKEFEEKIKWTAPQLIISDYNLAESYTGLEALFYVREHMPHVPFVFVTGFLNDEEKVADAVLNGAAGYILKDNLRELPNRLREIIDESARKFREAEARRQRERENRMLLQKTIAMAEAVKHSDNGKALLDTLLHIQRNMEA